MALFSILGESRIAMVGGEGDSITLIQRNPSEALLVDSFGGVSSLKATFQLPNESLPMLRAGLNPRSRNYPDRRGYWLSFRTKHDEIRNFPIERHEECDATDGITTVTVYAYDARSWFDTIPGLKSGGAGEVTDIAANHLRRITERVSSLDSSIVAGKNDQFLLPATVFDPTWVPTAKQISQGFISWASFEDSTPFTIKDTGAQNVREMVDELLIHMEAHYGERFELWPLETPAADGSNSPWFRWVLRKRIQTQLVLSEYSGTYAIDSVSGRLFADHQVYRQDDNLRFAFSSGTTELASEWIGPWARSTFEEISVDDNASPTFVPRPKMPSRVAFSGKGGVGYPVQPGSIGFVRNGPDVTPVNFDAVSTLYGGRDWNLGSIYSEMIHFDVISNNAPEAEAIVIKVAGSTTYTIPMQQAPLPAGGAIYSVWEGNSLLAQANFVNDPTSSSFANVLAINIGDTFEHTLRITVDGVSAYGRHVFGRANCWDGSLFDATNSVFRFMTAIVELPLHGYLREVTHTAGAGHALYTARQFQGCLALSSIPVTENWGGYNEAVTVKNLWGFIPLLGIETAKAYLGPHESQFELCLLLPVLPIEAHWPLLQKLAGGWRNRQFFGNTSATMGNYARFADMPMVTTIVSLGGGASQGWRRSQFENARVTGSVSLGVNMDALSVIPSYMLDRTFYNNDFVTSFNFVFTFGTSTLAGDFFGYRLSRYSNLMSSFAVAFTNTVSEVSGTYFLGEATAGNKTGTTAQTAPVTVTIPGLRTVSGAYFFDELYGGPASNGVAVPVLTIPDFPALEVVSGAYFMRSVVANAFATDVKMPEFQSLVTVSGTNFFVLALAVTRGYANVVIPNWNTIKTVAASFLYRLCWGGNSGNSANGQVQTIRFPALESCTTTGASFMQEAFVRVGAAMAVTFPAWDSFTSIGIDFCETLFTYYSVGNSVRTFTLPSLASLNVVPAGFLSYALKGNVSNLVIPDWNSFTSVGNGFCRGWSFNDLATIQFPALLSCTSVLDFFFANMSVITAGRGPSMATITMPVWNSFTSIGSYFLSECLREATAVTAIVWPTLNSCTSVAFYFLQSFAGGYTSVLTNLTFPAWPNLRTVGNYFLSLNLRGVDSITLPALSVMNTAGTGFLANLFFTATGITVGTVNSITIPSYSQITTIGGSPFQNAFTIPNLKTVNFPSTMFGTTALPNGFFSGAFRGSGIESIAFPAWGQFTSMVQATNATNGVLSYALADTALLTTVTLPSFPNIASGTVLYWMNGTFTGSGLVNGAQIIEKTWPSTGVTFAGNYMAEFFRNCPNLQTLPAQTMTGKSVNYGSYREGYARNCPALLPNQAVWDKPNWTTVPTSPTVERVRVNSAGGSNGTVHHWLDGSGAIVQPADGTNVLGIPSNFYTA